MLYAYKSRKKYFCPNTWVFVLTNSRAKKKLGKEPKDRVLNDPSILNNFHFDDF